MKAHQKAQQYTIRNLTPALDQRLREKAGQVGKSLNEVVLETLRKGIGLTESSPLQHDLDYLAGTWKEDPAFDEALKMQDKVDEGLWS